MSDASDAASVSPEKILHEAQNLALLAVSYDQQKDLQAAIYYYSESIVYLKRYLSAVEGNGGDDHSSKASSTADVAKKLADYERRLRDLQVKLSDTVKGYFSRQVSRTENDSCSSIERLEFLLNEALDEDEDDDIESALALYMEAVETGLKIKSTIEDQKLSDRLTFIITKALERAEALKGIGKQQPQKPKPKLTSLEQSFEERVNINDSSPTTTTTTAEAQLIVSGKESYSKEEISVLKRSSNINGTDYLPFMPAIDLRERFSTLAPFCDPKGLLALSPKQRASLVAFRRLAEIAESPVVVANSGKSIDCFAIKQTIVSDCSVIASLTVSALWERRFGRKLISNIIYPQNRHQEPVFNPCGKYMVKLHLNGILRKVIIDDRLPVGQYGQLLCSYSANKNEFWVSLLEKAYLKVMGGYDFPGSNSNIDLHALTGWIPERVTLSSSSPAEKEKLFKVLTARHDQGDVLVTFATGDFSDAESERTGLVPGHAYAMLDVKAVQGGRRLFLLKNPWAHVRWKGRFSERDVDSWTPALQAALRFDPKSAANFDNGIFWIDMESLVRFFDVAYLSWSPSIFKYSYCTHDIWNAGVGPVKDLYYIGANPQYSLSIKNPESSTWILLTRHIVDRNDFANNREYIALLVYKTNGEKVYLPFDPPPFIDGARINSPHYLCKILVNPKDNNPVLRYTLVISQYEKSNTILYSLRAYSTSPFSLRKIPNIYRHREVEKGGAWTRETAGGCRNHAATYALNPAYQLVLSGSAREEDNEVMLELRGPKDYAIGLEVTAVTLVNPAAAFRRADSGAFRSGFTYLKLKALPAGTYQIVPSTYQPGQTGPFFLTVNSTHPIKLSRLR